MGREYRGSELANLDWHLSICSKSDCLVILASGISRLNLNISVNETGRLFYKKSNTNKRDCCTYKSSSFKIPKDLNNGSV